jgi:ribosome-binding protein aMBF1 (putative translation factor)
MAHKDSTHKDSTHKDSTHQDWETVVLSKPVKVESKPHVQKNPLDTVDIVIPLKINTELKTAIQQARLAQKLSQKDLAAKLAIPVSTINTYENGTAIPNNAFIAKLEKALNTKLPRAKKEKATE